MSSFASDEQFVGLIRQEQTGTSLQDRVTRLFEEARDDVYRYLLTLGLYPPQAQEATQEVFLRLYATERQGEEIQNPRAWIFRVAHNLGLKIRARQHSEEPFNPDMATPLRCVAYRRRKTSCVASCACGGYKPRVSRYR